MLTVYIIKTPDPGRKHEVLRANLKKMPIVGPTAAEHPAQVPHAGSGKIRLGGWYVNVTYVDDYAFALITREPFGIDAEKVKPRNAQMKRVLARLLSKEICTDTDFFKAWTTMEAQVKYYGDKSLFDALTGMWKPNPALQTKLLMYKGHVVAITSTKSNINNQNISFRQI